jgi:hypothetical protein
MLFSYITTYKVAIMTHLALLERLKCESKSENNKRKKELGYAPYFITLWG